MSLSPQKTWSPLSLSLGLLLCLLLGACRSESPSAEIYRLSMDPTPENLERVREQIAAEDRDVRATALFVLASAGVPDAEDLSRRALEDPDGFVRATAAKLLGDLEAAGSIGDLVRHLLEDSDPIARQRCAEALGTLGGDEAERGLVRALVDPVKNVRRAAAEAVGGLNPEIAVDELTRLLRDDAEWEIRVQAARGLGLSRRPEAAAALESALDDPNEFVRAAAENALRRAGSD